MSHPIRRLARASRPVRRQPADRPAVHIRRRGPPQIALHFYHFRSRAPTESCSAEPWRGALRSSAPPDKCDTRPPPPRPAASAETPTPPPQRSVDPEPPGRSERQACAVPPQDRGRPALAVGGRKPAG